MCQRLFEPYITAISLNSTSAYAMTNFDLLKIPVENVLMPAELYHEISKL